MIRELSEEETLQVSGGVAPLVGLAASAIGHFTARSVISSLASRAGFAATVYGVAEHFSDN